MQNTMNHNCSIKDHVTERKGSAASAWTKFLTPFSLALAIIESDTSILRRRIPNYSDTLQIGPSDSDIGE